MNYENFKTACENFGKRIETMVEVKYYDLSDYGREDWYQAVFMVDKFGGDACIIKFYEGNLWYEAAWGRMIVRDLNEAFDLVPIDVYMEREARANVEIPFED